MYSKLFVLALATIAMAACAHKDNDGLGHDHGHGGHSHEAEAAEGSGHGEIVLDEHAAEQLGVESMIIEPSAFSEVISVSGQIVDAPNSASVATAPASGIVKFAKGMMAGADVRQGATIATVSASGVTGGDANLQAKAALEAAKAELDRLEPLYAERLVTAKTYNDAKAAYEQAKAAYSAGAASGRIAAATSGVVTELFVKEGEYVEAGTPVAAISSNKELTLRADLPEKYAPQLASIISANVVSPYTGEAVQLSELGGRRASSAQAVSAQRGYIPVFFTFSNNGKFMPGAFVKVNLLGAKRDGVLAVPVSALSEQQGAYFVYEQIDEDCYRKIPVRVGANDGSKAEILSGLNGGENIVVGGVVAVRLAETAAVAPEGHSHNH